MNIQNEEKCSPGGLTWKTLGGKTPRGCQRVFYCAAPEDYGDCLEELAAEVFSDQPDAAIWYPMEPGKQPDEEKTSAFAEDLSQMQLFLVPVTSAFLTTDNHARLRELPFAVAHHIPILPILREQALEEGVLAVFGNMQYLDPEADDGTGIPYEKKRARFLAQVLLGSDTIERIREAFSDRRIFLSYRKKNRRAAQEVMRRIHAVPGYLDVAIWYDEFLIPGEDFEELIREEMERSRLLALVVTPQVLELPNYVVDIEYPLAKELGRPILPVLTEPMNEKDLSVIDSESEFPPCAVTNEEIADGLSKGLGANTGEGDDSPEHLYLIGLAYHAGVDVETDPEKGIALITRAAEAGAPEACRELVSIYRLGAGVACNPETAAYWQERLVEQLRCRFQASGGREAADLLAAALTDLGYLYLNETGNRSLAEAAFREMYEVTEQWMKLDPDPEIRRNLAISEEARGKIAQAVGNLESAQGHYLAAIGILEQIREESTGTDVRRELALLYTRLGGNHWGKRELADARDYFEKSLALWSELADEVFTSNTLPNPVHAQAAVRRDLADGYRNLGDLETFRGDLTEAEKWYLKCFKIDRQLAKENKTDSALRRLLYSWTGLGRIRMKKGDLSEAGNAFRQALEIAQKLAVKKETILARRDLAACYMNMGDLEAELSWIEKLTGRTEASLIHRKHAFAHYTHVRSIYSFSHGKMDLESDICLLGRCLVKMGHLARDEKNWEQALQMYRQALEILEPAAEKNPTESLREVVANAQNAAGDIAQIQGNYHEAREMFLKVLDFIEEKARPILLPADRRNIANTYTSLAQTEMLRGGDREAAASYFSEAFRIYHELAEDPGTDIDQQVLEKQQHLYLTCGLLPEEEAREKLRALLLETASDEKEIRPDATPLEAGLSMLRKRSAEILKKWDENARRRQNKEVWEQNQGKRLQQILNKQKEKNTPGRPKLAAELSGSVIEHAIRACAPGIQKEEVLALLDITHLKNGKRGILYTEDALYSSEWEGKNPGCLPYAQIRSVNVPETGFLRLEKKNGEWLRLHTGKRTDVTLEILRAVL